MEDEQEFDIGDFDYEGQPPGGFIHPSQFRSRHPKHMVALIILLLLLSLSAASIVGVLKISENSTLTDNTKPGITKIAISNGVLTYLKKTLPSLVGIDVFDGGHWRYGTGILLSSSGYVLTTADLVGTAKQVIAHSLVGGRIFKSSVVSLDTSTGLSVVKIPATSLPAANIPKSYNYSSATTTMAVCLNPPASNPTIYVVRLAAYGKRLLVNNHQKFLDVMISDLTPGDCATNAVLVDTKGNILGIEVAKSPDNSYTYFESDALLASAQYDVLNYGALYQNWLGIVGGNLNSDSDISLYPSQYRQTITTTSTEISDVNSGVVVRDVYPGSPASSAGIEPGDIIETVNGNQVDSLEDLQKLLNIMTPNDRATLLIKRGGSATFFNVQLKAIFYNLSSGRSLK